MLLFAIAATGQRNVVLDSTFVTKVSTQFFETRVVRYDNGDEDTQKRVLGDSISLLNNYINGVSSRTASMANDVKIVREYRGAITELIRQDNALAQFGISPLTVLKERGKSTFLDSGFTWTLDGSAVSFNETNQGVFRYRVGSGTNSQCIILGDVLRLRNYPSSGLFTDVYKVGENRWTSINGEVVLRRIKKP